MHLRRTMGLLFLLLAISPSAPADNLTGNDLILTDGTPGVAFDDSDSVGWNWTVRGRDEYFRVYDEMSGFTWLRADLGTDSAAFGRNAVASSSNSVAVGNLANATNTHAIALGFSASAGQNAMALGDTAQAPGPYSNAIGYSAVAGSHSAVAIGINAVAEGSYSTALGARAYASQTHSVVLGSIKDVNGAWENANVGIGTPAPQAALHIMRSDATALILVEDTFPDTLARTMFRLAGGGVNTKFEIDTPSAGVNWAFTNAGTDFRISRQGSGAVEFSVANNGNATLAGAMTQNSDRNAKRAIVSIDTDEVLDKVAALPISQWQYKDDAGVNHVGPMAQDFHAAFGLGATDTGISSLDTGGVALAAIQALSLRNDALTAEVSRLRQANSELEDRLQRLEAVLDPASSRLDLTAR